MINRKYQCNFNLQLENPEEDKLFLANQVNHSDFIFYFTNHKIVNNKLKKQIYYIELNIMKAFLENTF